MTVQLFNEDCISGLASRLAPESVDLTVTSIPFGALFMYSGKTEDIGNNADGTDMRAGGFGLHMRFFIEQLHRVMRPGCNACIHIQQLLTYKVQHGYMGRRDFRGAVVDLFGAGGFEWKGEVAIPKNPQAMAQRLKLHSLMFATGYRDARQLSPAVNDYVMIFQRPGEATPVPALRDRDRQFADEETGEDRPELYHTSGWVTTEEWIKWASGVWSDIQETDVLDGYRSAREEDDERHVCPLQLEVIRRCIKLYSNPGEVVLDPFNGIGSTSYIALEQGRNAVGFELKESYHAQALKNIEKLQNKGRSNTVDMFTLLAGEEAAG